MAHKRRKGEKWEFVIKRAGLLPKPLYLTFDTEQAGDNFVAKVEALLDKGIVPHDLSPREKVLTIRDLVRSYSAEASPKQKDREVLATIIKDKGGDPTSLIDVNWVDSWVSEMKRKHNLAPATIRAKVGALARACDWAMRKKLVALPDHPFRTLPKGYATYTELDRQFSGTKKVDNHRDRRLRQGEDKMIREVISSGVIPRKQRDRAIEHKDSLLADYDLAVESAMRLRERYTLMKDDVDLRSRTIYLKGSRTKNGRSREVPLSSVAVEVVAAQLDRVKGPYLFPWWDGDTSEYALKMISNYLSKLYSDVFEAAGCPDLREHDLRHEATSRLFERTKLSAEQIMKITGHEDHKTMMRYMNPTGRDLASALW